MAVSNPCPLLSVFACWSREIFWWTVPDDMIRCHSLFTSSGNDSQLLALMWLNLHMDISPGLPAVILAKLNSNILDNTYIFGLPAANITSYHRCWMDYDMIFFGGILTLYALCMGYFHQLLLQHLPTTTFTDCYTRRFFSVLWWTRYTAALWTSRQILTNSVIYVGHDISIFLRRTWSLFSDSSLSLDVATVLRFVTLAGLDYLFPRHAIYAGHCYHSRTLLPDLDYIMLVEFVERPSSR